MTLLLWPMSLRKKGRFIIIIIIITSHRYQSSWVIIIELNVNWNLKLSSSFDLGLFCRQAKGKGYCPLSLHDFILRPFSGEQFSRKGPVPWWAIAQHSPRPKKKDKQFKAIGHRLCRFASTCARSYCLPCESFRTVKSSATLQELPASERPILSFPRLVVMVCLIWFRWVSDFCFEIECWPSQI